MYENPRVLLDCRDALNEGKFLCFHMRRIVSTTFSKAKVSDLTYSKRLNITQVVLEDVTPTILKLLYTQFRIS